MVMDDLTLKGVMDPSIIWTVICMVVNGWKAFEMLFFENGGFVDYFLRFRYLGCNSWVNGLEPNM